MPGQQVKAVPYRRINGEWPYLPAGIDRDTTLSQQGTTGRLEKNGASENRLWFDYAAKPGQDGLEMADHLMVSGLTQPPNVVRDGKPLAGPSRTTKIGGNTTYLVPLGV
jgi:hypothetical protein